MTPFDGWENFYLIVGPSAGALIGLQFVVVTLIAGMPVGRTEEQAAVAFSTPSVVHFGMVMFLSVLVSAPWEYITVPSILWCLMGIGGIVYTIITVRRMRRQTAYKPVFEDWLFHVVLPLAAYGLLAVSAYAAQSDAKLGLFMIAAVTLALLFVGIHNAWDNITYLVFVKKQEQPEAKKHP